MAMIAVIGCGGLGVPAAWTLALAGCTHLRLIDPDVVEVSNLHRQVAFAELDVGRAKVAVLAEFLRARCPGLCVETVRAKADPGSLAALLDGCDVAFDATDDATSKFAINDWAIARPRHRFAAIAAAIQRQGQWMVVSPDGPCYRCIFEEPPPPERLARCAVSGVMGPLTGQVGAMAALALWHVAHGRNDSAHGALVRLGPRGLLRTPVAIARGCACSA
jgi:adenylyltransferase/sulfurtransferase